MSDIELIFCTYFKRIERFKYEYETYEEYVAFCVKQGSFVYQIGDGKEQAVFEGEIVICPPNQQFIRKIIEPVELCMIKFNAKNSGLLLGEKIKVSNLLRWNEDLGRLENCLFCDTLSKEPLWAHYCMDILYIAIDSIGVDYRLSLVKDYIVQNYNREFYICEIAKQVGYTTPYMINKFKLCYGVTPKAYLSQIRIQKAKELLLTTDKFSREISDIVGFSDELYFIRFFKKHTGITPRRFRERGL